jgi:hypothetical protein
MLNFNGIQYFKTLESIKGNAIRQNKALETLKRNRINYVRTLFPTFNLHLNVNALTQRYNASALTKLTLPSYGCG